MTDADRLGDWVALVDALYPESDAEDWDRTGLQVGDPDDPVRAVLVALDVTAGVLDEAGVVGADLILAHHPLLFRPLQRLTPETPAGRLALRAARDHIAVLAAHTNFDVAQNGTSDPVVAALELRDVRPLAAKPAEADRVKLVTFIPAEHTGAVLAALSDAGAGVIGEYDRCSFRVSGTGTFRPSAAADPAVGEREQLNEVAEERLEIVLPSGLLPGAVSALVSAHPYEEVAYDVYPLVDAAQTDGKGLGRVGDLPRPLPLRAVADLLHERLPAPGLRVAGDLDADVRRVAACGGAGDSLIGAALAADADVYVTGDLRHHPVLDAAAMGLWMIDAGHAATEAASLPGLRAALATAAAQRGLGARLLASSQRTDPWAPYSPPEQPSS